MKQMKQAAKKIGILAIWIALWQIAYLLVGQELIMPSPVSVAKRIYFLSGQTNYWYSIAASMARITAGYLAGLAAGCLFAAITTASSFLRAFLQPLFSMIRATPVASFIILVFFWLTTDTVPVFTSFLMVLGIVWGNVSEGIAAVPKDLLEMAYVFHFSQASKIKNIYIPGVRPFFLASAVSSLGLAWKAGIAAEVICRPAFSIGKALYNAKVYLEAPDLFAWTTTIILLSIALEKIVTRLISPAKRRGAAKIKN